MGLSEMELSIVREEKVVLELLIFVVSTILTFPDKNPNSQDWCDS